MGVNLASFKNSRSYPRPAATQGDTIVATAPNNTTAPSKILDFDSNRVEAQVYNRHATDAMKFIYQNKTTDPVPTLADFAAKGFTVKAGDSYSIDLPVAVWALSTTVNDVPLEIDVGTG